MRFLGGKVLDFLLPRQCLGCGDDTLEATTFCGPCWGELSFIQAPACHVCGIPFDQGDIDICADCRAQPRFFTAARAAIRYNELAKKLIGRFKNNDQLLYGKLFGQWLAGLYISHGWQADIVIPVPLHWWRFWRRGFNQSAQIALYFCQALYQQHGIYLRTHEGLLKKAKHTKPQANLDKHTRLSNLEEAFYVPSLSDVNQKNILLIDDVLTTTATANACAKALREAGAQSVNVLAVARTPLVKST